MSERRFTDEETAAIFRVAAEGHEAGAEHASRLEGMTLAEVQAIGREVGLAPEALANAARLVDIRNSARTRRLLGLPIGVERRVNLGRKLSDDEWERLVVELREVFNARGRTRAEGSLRQWTNGNLYVLLEPTADGQRLRLGSLHGGATSSIRLGIALIASAAVLGIVSMVGGSFGQTVPGLIGGGLALTAIGALRVPGWARLRGRQMEDLAARLAPPARDALPPPRD